MIHAHWKVGSFLPARGHLIRGKTLTLMGADRPQPRNGDWGSFHTVMNMNQLVLIRRLVNATQKRETSKLALMKQQLSNKAELVA